MVLKLSVDGGLKINDGAKDAAPETDATALSHESNRRHSDSSAGCACRGLILSRSVPAYSASPAARRGWLMGQE
jgi:hypothetical protein